MNDANTPHMAGPGEPALGQAWIHAHDDYLDELARQDGARPVPLFGLRAAAVLNEDGEPDVFWQLDNGTTVAHFQLLGFLSALQSRVLAEYQAAVPGGAS